MGNAPSQSEPEEQDLQKGVLLSKSDTGGIRITEGFVEQLEEQARQEEGHWVSQGKVQEQLNKQVSKMVKEGKDKIREEIKSEMEEQIATLNQQLLEEKKANSDLKNTTFPIINELSDSVHAKLAPRTEAKAILCSQQIEEFFQCSKTNPSRTLYCKDSVDSYINCVRSQRDKLTYPPEIH